MIDRKFSPGRFPETRLKQDKTKTIFRPNKLDSHTWIPIAVIITLIKQLTNITRCLTDPAVTEAYVQGGTEIQSMWYKKTEWDWKW